MTSERDPRTHAIIGAAMEVHRELGCGFLEAVYQEALALELRARSIPFQRELTLPVRYKGGSLSTFYRADFMCFDAVLIEVKALQRLSGIEEAQVLNYLKATGSEVGLLLNFGAPSLAWKRLVRSVHWSIAASSSSVESADCFFGQSADFAAHVDWNKSRSCPVFVSAKSV